MEAADHGLSSLKPWAKIVLPPLKWIPLGIDHSNTRLTDIHNGVLGKMVLLHHGDAVSALGGTPPLSKVAFALDIPTACPGLLEAP